MKKSSPPAAPRSAFCPIFILLGFSVSLDPLLSFILQDDSDLPQLLAVLDVFFDREACIIFMLGRVQTRLSRPNERSMTGPSGPDVLYSCFSASVSLSASFCLSLILIETSSSRPRFSVVPRGDCYSFFLVDRRLLRF